MTQPISWRAPSSTGARDVDANEFFQCAIDTSLAAPLGQENRLTRGFPRLAAALGSLAVVMVGAASVRAQDATETCVDVQIGNDRATQLNCLNDQMKRLVEHEKNAPQPIAPIDSRSSSNQVGVYNDAAAREHMGNAFGVSSKPQRPVQVFVNPLTAH